MCGGIKALKHKGVSRVARSLEIFSRTFYRFLIIDMVGYIQQAFMYEKARLS